MTITCQLDYMEFAADDLAAIKRFYSAAFGWVFTDYGPDYISFSDGRLNGGFYRADQQADVASGSALVVLFCADLEAAYASVIASGGSIEKEIFVFPGGRRFHFRDPHGNELAIWSDAPAR